MMFDFEKKKNQVAKISETVSTVIGQGTLIEGQSFRSTGTVRVDGVYIGDMFVEGNVIVGQTGEIRGNITATTMTIAGTFIGNILCREEIHATETAVIEGDIQTNSIVVDQGAEMSGALSTRRKTLAEPINLDETIKKLQSNKGKIIDVDDEITIPYQ